MKLALATLLVCLLLAPAVEAKTIKVGDYWFGSPTTEKITVSYGKKITFKWVGNAPHNAVVKKGPQKWNSGVQTKGKKKKWRPKKRGKYKIICTLHSGMDFTLKVR